MPNLNLNNIDELRQHMSYYFTEIAYGIKNDNRKFDSMEYINFAMTDVITAFYYSLPDEERDRFKANIVAIGDKLD